MRQYLEKNIIPIIIEAVFIIFVFVGWPEMIYLNFLFYLLLVLYFAIRKEYSFKALKERITKKQFWKSVLITFLIIAAGFILMTVIQNTFSDIALGTVSMRRDTPCRLLLFAIQTIIFPPLAEEIFYRKYLIALDDSRNTTILMLVLSSFLFAAEHAVYPFGIATYMILGISFGIAYLLHKDIYAMMMAHFLVNLIGNGASVVITAIHMLN